MEPTLSTHQARPPRKATAEGVLPLSELSRDDVAIAGGKGSNLAELTRAGLPVPPGFVVTAQAYLAAMDTAGIRKSLLDRALSAPPDDPASLDAVSVELRESVLRAGMPEETRRAIVDAYRALGDGRVAVRSSATMEDTAGFSFAGMMFTADPAGGARDRMVIEAAFGLGEVVVSGQVEPDTYVVAKSGPSVLTARIGVKTHQIVRDANGTERRVDLAPDARVRRVLTDEQLLEVARMGLAIEAHYGSPQDVEWAYSGGELYALQSRPITTLPAEEHARGDVLLTGLGASPGVAGGRVRILSSPAEGSQLQNGEVLVAAMTSPDWVPTMRRAAALVTDGGGMTCHAAIVSRELRIPCIVGTREATRVLRNGEEVTVDGARGSVVFGGPRKAAPASTETATPTVLATTTATPAPAAEALATRIYVNLAFADHAASAAASACDGVGLLRAEFMITDALGGAHPRKLLAEGRRDEFVSKMSASVLRITRAFAPRPVIYRTYDFRTNEFGKLEGAEGHEPREDNPMIGYRGCYRYVKDPEMFSLDLDVLDRVRQETPNLHVMIPFVRTRWELEACLELIDAHPRLADLRGALRRGRRGRPGHHSTDHRVRLCLRPHVEPLRAGPLEPAGFRRAPRALRDHQHLGQPRRGRRGPARRRRGGAAAPARRSEGREAPAGAPMRRHPLHDLHLGPTWVVPSPTASPATTTHPACSATHREHAAMLILARKRRSTRSSHRHGDCDTYLANGCGGNDDDERNTMGQRTSASGQEIRPCAGRGGERRRTRRR